VCVCMRGKNVESKAIESLEPMLPVCVSKFVCGVCVYACVCVREIESMCVYVCMCA